jgi:hypothetical protein
MGRSNRAQGSLGGSLSALRALALTYIYARNGVANILPGRCQFSSAVCALQGEGKQSFALNKIEEEVMKTNGKYSLLAGLALLITCFVAANANAQAFKGEFTLTSQAQWGLATLPAGSYEIVMDSAVNGATVKLFRGKDAVALIPAQAHDNAKGENASLTIVRGYVRELKIPQAGVDLQYGVHRSKPMTAPEEREIAQIVPVATTGK